MSDEEKEAFAFCVWQANRVFTTDENGEMVTCLLDFDTYDHIKLLYDEDRETKKDAYPTNEKKDITTSKIQNEFGFSADNPICTTSIREAYGKDELEEMIVLIKCSFAGFKGCELHRIAYAGDDVCTDENLNWANSLGDTKYKKISKFLVDFHSSKEGYGSFNIDHEYKNHEWYLGMDEKGSWRIISYGYC